MTEHLPEHPDYKALIEEARRGTGGYSEGDLRSLAKSLAAAVDALVAENDRLLAKYDEDTEALVIHRVPRSKFAEAEAKLEAVRKYADERAWYARRNTTVDSVRIASDLFHILGLGPDGKEPESDG